MTHTPGPWTPDTWEWWRIRHSTRVMDVATVHVEHNGKDEAQANARLIATAPVLLEALKRLVADFDDRGVTEGSIGIAERAIISATDG